MRRGNGRAGDGAEAQAARLMRAFRLGPDDLAANRSGRLGDMQEVRLRRAVYSLMLVPVLLIVATVLDFVASTGNSDNGGARIMLAVVAVGLLGDGLGRAGRLRRAVSDGVVECHVGPVQEQVFSMSGRVAVNGQRFRLPVPLWRIEDGASYRVYVVPAARRIVAMEPVVQVPLASADPPVTWAYDEDEPPRTSPFPS